MRSPSSSISSAAGVERTLYATRRSFVSVPERPATAAGCVVARTICRGLEPPLDAGDLVVDDDRGQSAPDGGALPLLEDHTPEWRPRRDRADDRCQERNAHPLLRRGIALRTGGDLRCLP